jgi:hypothetical protein
VNGALANALRLVRAASQEVPVVKYALGLAGIAAAAAIVQIFLGKGISAAFIVGAMIVGMVLLIAISVLMNSKDPSIKYAARALLWAVTISFCIMIFFVLTAIIFGWPPVLGRYFY